MGKEKEKIQERLEEIEDAMAQVDFWADKDRAQAMIQEMNNLKEELAGAGKFDAKPALVTIFAGAGGLDAEDFVRMLFDMYHMFVKDKKWTIKLIHSNQNEHGGFRNISFEVSGKRAYGILKHEAGVHRLVRISPFDSNKKRHTSFAMVEVVPKLDKISLNIPDDEIEVTFTKSSGPGGQNVNKRETAVRLTHTPSGISVHVDSERSQEQNREKALELLRGKVYHIREEKREEMKEDLAVSKTTSNEWGSQIRSYILHPYQLVKDHRTNTEVRDVDKVLNSGYIQPFIDAFVS